MTDNAELLKELKKMNEFLEKIDWKLWNLHKKYYDEVGIGTTTVTKTEAVPKEVEPVATATTMKYPTIETWD